MASRRSSKRASRSTKPAALATRRRTSRAGGAEHHLPAVSEVQQARELFWQNVVRELLTGLSMASGREPQLMDGRFAIITRRGRRIPIAQVFPLFACSLTGGGAEHALAVAVECTVFRITTPDGEVFTLPLHEVRAIHSLTEELVKRLEQDAMETMSRRGARSTPFGFAAFTSEGRSPGPGARNGTSDGTSPAPGDAGNT